MARYLDGLPNDARIVLDTRGWSIGAQVAPSRLEDLFLIHDFRFRAAVGNPEAHGVSYFLVPNPSEAPNDLIVQSRPSLWVGEEPGFELVKSFPETPEEWRVYKVVESKP